MSDVQIIALIIFVPVLVGLCAFAVSFGWISGAVVSSDWHGLYDDDDMKDRNS